MYKETVQQRLKTSIYVVRSKCFFLHFSEFKLRYRLMWENAVGLDNIHFWN